MAVCSGTKRDGEPCTASSIPGERWCYHHHPVYAEERRASASRAATVKHSSVGKELREVRETVKELLELTLSNELHPSVRKNLQNIVQLLQTYARLAELELAAGEKPRPGDVSLPEGTKERVTGWVEGEEAKEREREALVEGLSQAMKARGYDPTPIREVMGG